MLNLKFFMLQITGKSQIERITNWSLFLDVDGKTKSPVGGKVLIRKVTHVIGEVVVSRVLVGG